MAAHTHLNFKFKAALYTSTLVITLFNSSTKLFEAEIITVTQEVSLPINTSSTLRHTQFKAEALCLVSNVQQLKRLLLL